MKFTFKWNALLCAIAFLLTSITFLGSSQAAPYNVKVVVMVQVEGDSLRIPYQGARVTIDFGPPVSRTTDITGAAQFGTFEGGNYNIRIEHDGYFAWSGMVNVAENTTVARIIEIPRETAAHLGITNQDLVMRPPGGAYIPPIIPGNPIPPTPGPVPPVFAGTSATYFQTNALFNLKIFGSYFQSGARLYIYNTAAAVVGIVQPLTFIHTQELRVSGTAAIPAGNYYLQVVNPDGRGSAPRPITVYPQAVGPTFYGVTPNVVYNRMSFTLNFYGAGFQPDAVLQFSRDGYDVFEFPLAFVNSTNLRLHYSGEVLPGLYWVRIRNPNHGFSNYTSVTVY